ncbi:hypothetical protein EMCRGX_G029995 [Ephydatia muelleri]
MSIERVAIVRLYFSNGKNAYLTVSLFRREYCNYRTLCSSTVLRVVPKFVEHGTVQDRLKTNCGRKKTVQVPRNVGIIAQKMWQTPTLSIRRLHLGTGLRRSSVQKMLRKTLKIKAYRQPLVQALLPEPTCFDGMQQSEEGWCDGLGWADQRPYHWPLLHHWKCHRASIPSATTAEGVASPASWKRKNVLFSSMTEPQLIMKPMLEPGWGLEDRWMGRGGPIPWPAQSPDLSPLDFWLWGYLKNKVYANAVTTLDQLRQAITDEIQAILATMVQCATLGVVRKAELLIDGLQLGSRYN